jgi:hypothetical protein
MRERDIRELLIKQVKAAGGELRKVKWPGRKSAPDELVLIPGGPSFFIELKAPGGKPTAAQTREHTRLRKAGFRVEVISSVEEIYSILGGQR